MRRILSSRIERIRTLLVIALCASCLSGAAQAGEGIVGSSLTMPFEHLGARIQTTHPFVVHKPGLALALSAGEFRIAALNAPESKAAYSLLTLSLLKSTADARLLASDPGPGISNFLLGQRSSDWISKVPHYATLVAKHVYPGVDLVLRQGSRLLDYELQLAPGADLSTIALLFDGASKLYLDDNGDLQAQLQGGNVVSRSPVFYQLDGGKKHLIPGGFRMLDENVVGFAVDRYDDSRLLFIQPAVDYVSVIESNDNVLAQSIAIDEQGSAYIAGTTLSHTASLPVTPGAPGSLPGGNTEGFVVKLSADGSSLLYATYLGGSDTDRAWGIAVDKDHNAYVTGETYSTDFPVTPGVFQATNAGRFDAFITKLNASGTAFVYSTYVGGHGNGLGDDEGSAIAVDRNGVAYITGVTGSGDFPTTANAHQPTKAGLGDSFLFKLSQDGSTMLYASFLGGPGADHGHDIALDRSRKAYVVGETWDGFPATPDAFQGTPSGAVTNGFVSKIDTDAGTLAFSTYLTGTSSTLARAVTVTSSGDRIYVTGDTGDGFPVSDGAFLTTLAGGLDAFVAALNASGSGLVFATYLGGADTDRGNGIGVDANGYLYVTGETDSDDFPIRRGALSRCQGGIRNRGGWPAWVCGDAFLARLDNSGSRLSYGSYFGGPLNDSARDIAVSAAGDAYITGFAAGGIPTLSPGTGPVSGVDGFVIKLSNRQADGCPMELNQTVFTSGQSVLITQASVDNDRFEPAMREAKVYHRQPDGVVSSLINQGGDGTWAVPARSSRSLLYFSPRHVLTISAATPRGRHLVACTVRDPRTGELLGESTTHFEVQ